RRLNRAPGAGPAFGEVLLADERAALVGARVQAGRGHHLLHTAEARHLAELGTNRRRPLGPIPAICCSRYPSASSSRSAWMAASSSAHSESAGARSAGRT